MERKKFVTMIDLKKFENEDFVLGRITGVEYALCKKADKHYCHIFTDMQGRKIMIIECTEAQYKRFSEVIEDMYPGICEFDI